MSKDRDGCPAVPAGAVRNRGTSGHLHFTLRTFSIRLSMTHSLVNAARTTALSVTRAVSSLIRCLILGLLARSRWRRNPGLLLCRQWTYRRRAGFPFSGRDFFGELFPGGFAEDWHDSHRGSRRRTSPSTLWRVITLRNGSAFGLLVPGGGPCKLWLLIYPPCLSLSDPNATAADPPNALPLLALRQPAVPSLGGNQGASPLVRHLASPDRIAGISFRNVRGVLPRLLADSAA